jgi:hypothetical protein
MNVDQGSFLILGINVPALIVYILVALFVVIAALMITGTKVNFSAWMPHALTRQVEDAKIELAANKFWKADQGLPFQGLIVKQKDFPITVSPKSYTVSVEMLVLNSRSHTSEEVYRHILHRGTNELAPLTESSSVVDLFTNTNSCSYGTGIYGNLPAKGLPGKMNPGIFGDPYTNDIHVFVDTTAGRESVKIVDIPMDVPFHLTVIVQGRLLEVYINCGLEISKILKGTPIGVPTEWYGVSGPKALSAQLQNLIVWTFPLSSDDLRTRCPPITFNKKMPMCTQDQRSGAAKTCKSAA